MVEVEITIRMTKKQEETLQNIFNKHNWKLLVVSRKEIDHVSKSKETRASVSNLESRITMEDNGVEKGEKRKRCSEPAHETDHDDSEDLSDHHSEELPAENDETLNDESAGEEKISNTDSLSSLACLGGFDTGGAAQCKICGKFFISQTFLNAHNEIHVDHEALTCSVCLRIFKNKRLLKSHQLVHFDLRRYKCPSCGRAFKRVDHMRRHQKCRHPDEVHTLKLSRYDCTLCDQVFVHKGNLDNHLKLHHSI